jgi:hypothetical protein
MTVEWTQLAPAMAGIVLGLVLWLSAHRMHANLRRKLDEAKAERDGHAPS